MTPETVLIPGDVLDQEVQEEDGEGEGQPEDQPHVDELDVGGRGQLVRHRHVEGVHHCREQKYETQYVSKPAYSAWCYGAWCTSIRVHRA